jgi:hypothetical protein
VWQYWRAPTRHALPWPSASTSCAFGTRGGDDLSTRSPHVWGKTGPFRSFAAAHPHVIVAAQPVGSSRGFLRNTTLPHRVTSILLACIITPCCKLHSRSTAKPGHWERSVKVNRGRWLESKVLLDDFFLEKESFYYMVFTFSSAPLLFLP